MNAGAVREPPFNPKTEVDALFCIGTVKIRMENPIFNRETRETHEKNTNAKKYKRCKEKTSRRSSAFSVVNVSSVVKKMKVIYGNS